jgi:hypothetical protein
MDRNQFQKNLQEAMNSLNASQLRDTIQKTKENQVLDSFEQKVDTALKTEIMEITTRMSLNLASKNNGVSGVALDLLKNFFKDEDIYLNQEKNPNDRNRKEMDLIIIFFKPENQENKKIIPIAISFTNMSNAMFEFIKNAGIKDSQNNEVKIENKDDAIESLENLFNTNIIALVINILNKNEKQISFEVDGIPIEFKTQFIKMDLNLVREAKKDQEKNSSQKFASVGDNELLVDSKLVTDAFAATNNLSKKDKEINEKLIFQLMKITTDCANMIATKYLEKILKDSNIGGEGIKDKIWLNRIKKNDRKEMDLVIAFTQPIDGKKNDEKIIPISLEFKNMNDCFFQSLQEQFGSGKVLDKDQACKRLAELFKINCYLSTFIDTNNAKQDGVLDLLNNNTSRTSKENGDQLIISNKVKIDVDGEEINFKIQYVNSRFTQLFKEIS